MQTTQATKSSNVQQHKRKAATKSSKAPHKSCRKSAPKSSRLSRCENSFNCPELYTDSCKLHHTAEEVAYAKEVAANSQIRCPCESNCQLLTYGICTHFHTEEEVISASKLTLQDVSCKFKKCKFLLSGKCCKVHSEADLRKDWDSKAKQFALKFETESKPESDLDAYQALNDSEDDVDNFANQCCNEALEKFIQLFPDTPVPISLLQ